MPSYWGSDGQLVDGRFEIVGRSIAAANKATAGTVDGLITASFNHVSVINDGPNELKLSIDADSTTSPRVIFVGVAEPFEASLSGTSLHHSVQSGSAVFRYVLT